MSSFGTFLIGFIVIIIGVAAAAYMAGVSPAWIAIGCVILLGLGIVMATNRTKPRDPPAV